MSTIHAFTDWQHLSDTPVELMLATSESWQPDQTTCAQASGAPVYLGRASFFNTQYSQCETIFSSPCGNYWLAANARLDNRATLIQSLGLNHHAAKAAPLADGYLILHAYMQWGQQCPAKLLGDFAFIVWDNTRKAFFCARDPMGIKSLFYARSPARAVLISNDCDAILNTGHLPAQLSHEWLAQTLLPGYKQGYSPMIEGIQKIEPGHYALISQNDITTKCYWNIPHQDLSQLDEDTYLTELYKRLETAVQRRLDSEYPLGCELSEGLDSSAITALTARLKAPETVYTFSYQCEEETDANRHIWSDTYKDIKAQIAMYPNLTPLWRPASETRHTPTPARAVNGLGTSAYSGFLQPELLAQQGIRTLLSGWGGDHCVTSYGDHYEDELFRRGKLLQLHKLMTQKRARGRGITPWKGWLLLAAKHIWPALFHRRVTYRNDLTGQIYRQLRQHPLNRHALNLPHVDAKVRNFVETYSKHSVRERDYRELFEITPEQRLTGSELAARQARVEYRFPMLDTELVTWAYNAPPYLKIKGGVERYMFREITKGLLTERNRTRRKADVSHPNHERAQSPTKRRHELLSTLRQNYNPKLAAFMPREATLRFYQQQSAAGTLRPLEAIVAVNNELNQGTLELEPRP